MLLFHILFTLAITAVAVAIWISALQVPSFDRVAPKYFFQGLTIHGDVDADLLCAIHHHRGLLCADFHAICPGSCNESVREVLELIATASHKVNVVCKLEVAEWSTTNGGGVVVLEGLMPNFFLEQAE